MTTSRKEVEIKLPVADAEALRRRLARLGARPAPPGRLHEMNTLFDTPEGGFAKQGQLLRVRVEEPASRTGRRGRAGKAGAASRRVVLTYKGPSVAETAGEAAQGGRYKVREEREVSVADAEDLQGILESLGLRGWFRYEKYRTSYRLPASQHWAAGLHVDLDETPLGAFIELEGTPQAIDQAAGLLGYAPGDYITKSYRALYLDRCRKHGHPTGDMLFSSKNK
jgi:adenylate cyclase class 2